ncbi:SMC-Scp complex subunit ScpB [Oleiphilus sp. HI0125]|uniref:SMC-Scp complex subunit ScpB n=1 Tax=Oleiphilus sp. HI0125 TaxID=1822266 RepID=UPI0009EF39AE|nr:SMC-Scp complex subunit ScpB [Oleiphilus sp. HI0125]
MSDIEITEVNQASLARSTSNSFDLTQLKRIVEATLMASDKPMSVDKLHAMFELHEQPQKSDIRLVLEELQNDYLSRGIQLSKVASGYRFQTAKDLSMWVGRLWEERPQKYSRALLETLSLIAYRQPITRGEIEDVRGVAVSTHIMKTLLERQWIKVVGHREVPGRPAIYATTKLFLDYFNLSSLEQLPPLSEMRDIDAIAKDVSEQLELVVENQTNESGEGF